MNLTLFFFFNFQWFIAYKKRVFTLSCRLKFYFRCITKTYLYNFDPLKPHFYIVKLGLTGVYIISLISAQNIDCGYLLEPPRQKYEKYLNFLSENFQFLEIKFSIYLNRRVFVMGSLNLFWVLWKSNTAEAGACGEGASYAASQSTLLKIRLNKIEPPTFVLLCRLCF